MSKQHNLNKSPISTYEAIKTGDLEIIKERIESRQIQEKYTHGGMSALHIAARYGQIDIARELLKSGADIEQTTSESSSGFHHDITASANATHLTINFTNDRELLNLLIESKANINLADSSGSTPLSLTIQNKKFDMSKIILQNPEAKFDEALTPQVFSYILENNDVDLLQLIINKSANNKNLAFENKSLLCHAVQAENFEISKTLIDAGADVNFVYEKESVLYYAIKHGCTDIAEALIEAEADVNFKSRSEPLLHYAIKKGNLDIIKALINAGANVNSTYEKHTVLSKALSLNNFEIIQILLEKRANPNAPTKELLRNNYTKSVLHKSLQLENKDIFKLLIEKGGDINFIHENKYTHGHDVDYDVIFSYFLDIKNIQNATFNGSYKISLLFAAVLFNNLEALKFLLDQDADIYNGFMMEITKAESIYYNYGSRTKKSHGPQKEIIENHNILSASLKKIKQLEINDADDLELEDAVAIFKSIINAGFDFYSDNYINSNKHRITGEGLKALKDLSAESKKEVVSYIFKEQGANAEIITPNVIKSLQLQESVEEFNRTEIAKLLTYLHYDYTSAFSKLSADIIGNILKTLDQLGVESSELINIDYQEFKDQKLLADNYLEKGFITYLIPENNVSEDEISIAGENNSQSLEEM